MGRDGRGVRAASDSSIEITFTYRDVRCRERIPLQPTPANLKRAVQHRAAILYAIATNSFDYATTFPDSPYARRFAQPQQDERRLDSYLLAWLERQQQHVKTSTYNGYRKIIYGRLIPHFGATLLPALRKRDVRNALGTIEVSNKTLANIQSVLRKALSDAIEDELIQSNPLAGWCYRKNEAPKQVDLIDPFTKDEQAAILRQLSEQGRNLIQFAFWTGMRTSELVALNWTDIDFVRGVVMVSKAMTQQSKQPEVTKTVAGRREIKLLDLARAALQAQKQHTFLKGQEVFQNPRTGLRWSGDQPIRKTLWSTALKQAGVRYRTPSQPRHTYASMMLSAGEHPMWVAKQMGHADWTMIARVYGRWMPDADLGAGQRAERLFGPSRSSPPSHTDPQ